MTRPVRRLVVALLVGAAAVVIPVLPVTAAHATAYRYWTYWHAAPGSSSWGFAGGGPTYRPSDGAVEGWRFAVSQGTTSAPQPRTDPAKAYTSACKGRTPADGMKLVAVVLDYGTVADAPKGEKPPHGVVAACVEIPKNGNGFDVLREADVTVRQDGGLICGLNRYPRTECAPAVTASPTSTAKPVPMPTPTKPSPAPSPAKSQSSAPPDRSPSSSGAATHSVTATASGSASDLASVAASSRTATTTPTPTTASESSAGSRSASAEAAPSLVVGDVAADPDDGGSPWALIVGGTVLVLIVGAAALRARWNR